MVYLQREASYRFREGLKLFCGKVTLSSQEKNISTYTPKKFTQTNFLKFENGGSTIPFPLFTKVPIEAYRGVAANELNNIDL